MASTLQQRVAARGFPVLDISGQSGQGALPDSTRPGDGSMPGQPTSTWSDPNNDPASVPATLPAPESYVLGLGLWGLPGASKPDNTPRTHAAPFADPTLAWQDGARKNSAGIGAYNAELEATHGPEFNGVRLRRHPGTVRRFGFGQQLIEGNGVTGLAPVSPAMRGQAGYDAVQGYGGGGDGLGGTNATMPLTVLDRQFPGPEGQKVFVNAAEKAFAITDADQFIATAPELPPFVGVYDAPNTTVSAQDVTVTDTPAQGSPVAQAAGLLPLWGAY